MIRSFLLTFALAFIVAGSSAYALTDPESSLKNQEIGFYTKLGAKIDIALPFTDAQGEVRQLSSFLKPGVPTILLPVYYGCPRLCGFLLNGFVDLVKKLSLVMGKEYNVVAVSFNPDDRVSDAKAKADSIYEQVGKPEANSSTWSFLVGKPDNITKLMNDIGFRYQKDGEDYAHGSGFVVLTPSGEISQFFTGIEFPAWDVRLSLVEASKGGIGSAIDHILLFCYKFDPLKGKYTLVAFNVLRGGVLAAIGLFFAAVFVFSKRLKQA